MPATSNNSKPKAYNTLLPAVFSDLQEYVIEEKEGRTKLNIPVEQINFDRDLIRANFKDCIIHHERNCSHNIVEFIHK